MILHDKTLGEIHVGDVKYHINGETGEPFHTVAFKSEAGELVGIVFDEPKYIALVDPMFPGQRYRGDDFESVLRKAIAMHRRG